MKKSNFQIILEQCIGQLRQGASIETCLSEHPEHREKLEPLLRMALRLSEIEQVRPSEEFVAGSKARILNRISEMPVKAKTSQRKRNSFADTISGLFSGIFSSPAPGRRYMVPVAAVVIVAVLASLAQFVFFKPSITLAAPCTLNVFNGDVEVQSPGTNEWQNGTNRMPLDEGTIIKTRESSQAILTFFAGSSSIKLEPSTEVLIQELDNGDGETVITLMQNTGKTWSFVGTTPSGEINYQVRTSSASAYAVGTLFTVEIDDEGSTTVAATDGTVKVTAQDSQVFLSKLQKVKVKSGEALPEPSSVSPPTTEIVLAIENGTATSITDPNGLSTGNLESGFSYNQIAGSQSVIYPEGAQVITIPEPVNGEYVILLSCDAPGVTDFKISITSDSNEVFTYSGSLLTSKQKLWLIHLDMSVDNGVVSGASVNDIEALKNGKIDDVVTVSPSVEEQEKGKAQSEKDKGKPDKEDKENQGKGPDKDEEIIEEEDNGQGQGNQGNNEDKGNQNQGNNNQSDKDNNGQGQGNKEEDKGNQSQDNSNNGQGNSDQTDKDNNGQSKKDEEQNGNKNKEDNSNKDPNGKGSGNNK